MTDSLNSEQFAGVPDARVDVTREPEAAFSTNEQASATRMHPRKGAVMLFAPPVANPRPT
jgi:hypothetical protein